MPSILSRPIRIGRMELKNRMVMAPMGVTVEHAHEQQQIACDTVLLALGFAPTAQAAAAFESVAPVTVLGDAQQPRKILFAVGDAHEAVRKLSD